MGQRRPRISSSTAGFCWPKLRKRKWPLTLWVPLARHTAVFRVAVLRVATAEHLPNRFRHAFLHVRRNSVSMFLPKTVEVILEDLSEMNPYLLLHATEFRDQTPQVLAKSIISYTTRKQIGFPICLQTCPTCPRQLITCPRRFSAFPRILPGCPRRLTGCPKRFTTCPERSLLVQVIALQGLALDLSVPV